MKFLLVVGLVALASATNPCKPSKGWSYCRSNRKCGDGYGDCDGNHECLSGLTCVSSKPSIPNIHSWPYDCCKCPAGIGNGGWHSCKVNCKCGVNGGDCDSNAECTTGHCRSSVAGQALGGSAKDYCCEKSGHWSACNTGNCKCHNGQGDCDSDAQCATGLKCLSGKGGQAISGSAKDVCTKIVNKGWSGCTSSKKCGHGEGDCDHDRDCKSGHVCVSTKNGQALWGSAIDVCVKKILTTAEEDMSVADSEDMDEAAPAETDDDDTAEPVDDAAVETTEDAAEVEGEADAIEQEDELVDEE